MSKNNKQSHSSSNQAGGAISHAAEYRIIKFDLIKVVILNAVYLIAILSLYFANKNSHFMENWFAKILHF